MCDVQEVSRRLAAVEARLAVIERDALAVTAGDQENGDPLWVLNGIKDRFPAPGGVLYAGSVETVAGPVDWQVAYPTQRLLSEDWAAFATTLAALGHPVRLSILQAVIAGVSTVADLAQIDGMGTTGQLYHHIHQLTAQGWLVARGRGKYSIPAERVVPLLAVLAAAHH